ncbi:MAG: hypothetical protein OXC10_00780 [Rhodospirillaceae bacterium]|nr:hypothetical protein [Rhodospirillaceae bacterium]
MKTVGTLLARLIVLSFVFLLAIAGQVSASCVITDSDIEQLTDNTSLPVILNIPMFKELYDKIHSAPVEKYYNVSGHHRPATDIVSGKQVAFTSGSTLEWTNLSANYFAIAAEEIMFEGRDIYITRTRENYRDLEYKPLRRQVKKNLTPPRAEDGVPGAQGDDASKRRSHKPTRGANGTDGQPGENGWSRSTPCLIIIAKSFEIRRNLAAVVSDSREAKRKETVKFNIDLPGLRGVAGGNGGNGGNGGKGQPGAHASESWLKCKRGATKGGPGGNGGNGGNGGVAAPGSSGTDIIIVGPESVARAINSLTIRNDGGVHGEPGRGGAAGAGGEAGNSGRTILQCPEPPGNGAKGNNGKRGVDGHVAPFPGHHHEPSVSSGSKGRILSLPIDDVSWFFEATPK